jgi:bifunctional DNA-binding transcriptional regulator/antitoxin component of YhaV-PrlF toxin-antitoxin module
VPVSRDGVVTIPEDGERLGVSDGDPVQFVLRDDGVIELRQLTRSLDGVFGPMPTGEVKQGSNREVAIGHFMRLSNAESFKKILCPP